MNSNRKTKLNTIIGLANQIVTIVCGFILPAAILKVYGSEINGLVNSITQFLGFISLCELGVGAVVQSALYRPLAEKNNDQISAVMKSSQTFFSKVALVLVIYVIGLLFFFPATASEQFDFFFTAALIVAISISLFAQYYFGISNQLLLYADQKVYIPMVLNIAVVILNTVVSVILINIGISIQVVKLMTSVIYLLRPLLMKWYVNIHYVIDKKIKIEKEPIEQKWDGLAQHFCTVVVDRSSVIVLTFFSLTKVSIYTMYSLVVNGLYLLISSLSMGIQSLMGNLIARNEDKKLRECFTNYEWLMHFMITLIYSIAGVLITPFIILYTRDIKDANYNTPMFGVLLTLAYFVLSLQVIYKTIIKSAGHFRETRSAVLKATILNIVCSAVCVFMFGLIGAAWGILISMSFLTIYYVIYISNNILFRSARHFIKLIVTDMLIMFVINILGNCIIKVNCSSYVEWIVEAIKVSAVAMLISLLVHFVIYVDKFKMIIAMFRRK